MTETRWTPEDETTLEAQLRDAPRLMRERLLVRIAAEREQRARAERRRARLRRLTFGMLGKEKTA